mmetsp:Transcript_4475/g.6684  ORF Transcript_4475/g.6684 Transcript_4475/m.6684 type:complete len:80 (-) Transcript_4475:3821-4060(-)
MHESEISSHKDEDKPADSGRPKVNDLGLEEAKDGNMENFQKIIDVNITINNQKKDIAKGLKKEKADKILTEKDIKTIAD